MAAADLSVVRLYRGDRDAADAVAVTSPTVAILEKTRCGSDVATAVSAPLAVVLTAALERTAAKSGDPDGMRQRPNWIRWAMVKNSSVVPTLSPMFMYQLSSPIVFGLGMEAFVA